MKKLVVIGLLAVLVAVSGLSAVSAQRYESDNFTIDASVGNSFGGASGSSSYQMFSSGGESIIGNGAGGSYMLGQGFTEQLQRGMRLTVQPEGLVGYYDFDVDGAIAYDNSHYGNNGTIAGTPTHQQGKVGRAGTFGSSSSNSVALGNPSHLQTNDVTISSWINTTQQTGTNSIIKKDNNYFFTINFRFLTIYNWSTGTTCSWNQSIADGEWHHVAMSVNEGETDGAGMYIDGEKVRDCTMSVVDNDSPVIIGNNSFSVQQFNGVIDELKIFDRPLSPLEIKAEYEAGEAEIRAGLAFPEDIISGSSQTTEAEAIIETDAPGYNLTLSQNSDLSSGGNTIPSAPGTIASPASWSEGATVGLGVSVVSASATLPDGKWSGGNAYAALPSSPTSVYTRSGYTGGQKDRVLIRYRLDVESGQPNGSYSNIVTYTGTITP